MAGALMRGMMRGNLGVRDIVAYDLCGEKVLALGVAQAHSVEEAARLAPILVVAVKPKDVGDVLRQLRDAGYPARSFPLPRAGRRKSSPSVFRDAPSCG